MSNTFAAYDGYGENYRKLLPKLKKPDLIENACRLGASPHGENAIIPFLCRDYIITHNGVEPADGLPASANNRSILIFYATSEGAGELTGEFALLNRLTGMIDGQNSLAKDMMTTPLVREFGDNYNAFAAAVTRLGGTELPAQGSGKHVWQLQVLPKIMVQIVFYEADDEFPAEIQIMFDKATPRFLEFECMAFLTGSMVQALIHCARHPEEQAPLTTEEYPI